MTEFSAHAVLMAIEAVRNNDYQIMSIRDHSLSCSSWKAVSNGAWPQ